MKLIRRLFGVVLLLCAVDAAPGQENARVIAGRYRNLAEGFSVEVPQGLKGIAGDDAGPERGVKIQLEDGSKIVVYGEANSLEWKDTGEAIRWSIENRGAAAHKAEVTSVHLGPLPASHAVVQSEGYAKEMAVAFRLGGGPIYWAELESNPKNFAHDHSIFMKIVQSFRVEAWK